MPASDDLAKQREKKPKITRDEFMRDLAKATKPLEKKSGGKKRRAKS